MADIFVAYHYARGFGNQVLGDMGPPTTPDEFTIMQERLRMAVREPTAVVMNWIPLTGTSS